jgi:hypothetical protein
VPGSRDWPGQPDAPDTPGQLRSGSPRPDSPSERSDEARPADRLAADDRPARWSRDDLRQRLERLPPGHPSSPHADDRDHSSPRENIEPYRQADDAAERSFWSEKPRFLQAWADHVLRWPDERVAAAVDRSRDPAGSWRGDGGQYLNPEQNQQSKQAIDMVQRKEKPLTEGIREIERQNTGGGWLEGLEHRLKGEDRLKEKIADLLATSAPDATIEEVLYQVSDAIRYTFCAESANYKVVYWDVKEQLQALGFEILYSQNYWSDTQYKGINTRWITPAGQRFEVQFHTPESFYAKQHITHDAYERLRNPLTQDDERQELLAFQEEVCSWVPVPEAAAEIPDYRKEGY